MTIQQFGEEVHRQAEGSSMKGMRYNEQTGVFELVDEQEASSDPANSIQKVAGQTWA